MRRDSHFDLYGCISLHLVTFGKKNNSFCTTVSCMTQLDRVMMGRELMLHKISTCAQFSHEIVKLNHACSVGPQQLQVHVQKQVYHECIKNMISTSFMAPFWGETLPRPSQAKTASGQSPQLQQKRFAALIIMLMGRNLLCNRVTYMLFVGSPERVTYLVARPQCDFRLLCSLERLKRRISQYQNPWSVVYNDLYQPSR